MAVTITGNYTDNVNTASGNEVSVDLNAVANAYNGHELNTTTAHGATGAVVGTTNTQTLTNKTINSSVTNTTTDVISITANSLTTGNAISIATTGSNVFSGALITANSNTDDATARNLVNIVNDHTGAAGAVNLRLQQDSTGDILQVYDGETLTTRIDDLGQVIAPMLVPGQVQNLGMSYAANTLTITAADGTALSATNPGWACVYSNTEGRYVTVRFAAPVTLTDGAASDTDGNTFGITSAVNWANSMPLFIGIIYNGTTAYFTLSRLPLYKSGAAATDLFQKGDTDGDAQTDVMIIATGLTLTDWVNLPITQVGWIMGTWTAATTSWTFDIEAYNPPTGFNHEYEKVTFTFPVGQNGAAATKHCLDNGGTAPGWAAAGGTEAYGYRIERTGMVYIEAYFYGADPAGLGAVSVEVALPYVASLSAPVYLTGLIIYGAGLTTVGLMPYIGDGNSYFLCPRSSDGVNVQNGGLTDNGNIIQASGYFKVF